MGLPHEKRRSKKPLVGEIALYGNVYSIAQAVLTAMCIALFGLAAKHRDHGYFVLALIALLSALLIAFMSQVTG